MRYNEIIIERKTTTQYFYNAAYQIIFNCLSKHIDEANENIVVDDLRNQLQHFVNDWNNINEYDGYDRKIYITTLNSPWSFGSFNEWTSEDDGYHEAYKWNINLSIKNMIFGDEHQIDVEKSAKFIAKVFAHEYLHFIQRYKSKNFRGKPLHSKIKNSPIKNDYRASSNEIHAFAVDTARELVEYYGSPKAVLEKIKTNDGIVDAMKHSIGLKGYFKIKDKDGGEILFQQFIKEVFKQLISIK